MKWYNWLAIGVLLSVMYAMNSQASEFQPVKLAGRDDPTDYSFRYGVGYIKVPTSEIKAFSLRAEDPLFGGIYEAKELGLWSDTGEAQGRHSAGFGAYQLGIRPSSEHFGIYTFWGLSALTRTDSQLGGIAQFTGDFGIRYAGGGDSSFVTFGWKHISSAGIWTPNKGRDFLLIGMGLSW